jgi:hypothetical protein
MKIYKPRRTRIGLLKLAFNSNLAYQFQQRFGALKTLRPRFEKKPVLPNAPDKPPNARRSFKKNYGKAKLL